MNSCDLVCEAYTADVCFFFWGGFLSMLTKKILQILLIFIYNMFISSPRCKCDVTFSVCIISWFHTGHQPMKIPLIILLSNINNYLNNTFGKCFIHYDPKGVTKPISSSGTEVWAGAIFPLTFCGLFTITGVSPWQQLTGMQV